ncbi:MAG: hypothetical protein OEQ25_14595 [Gammaproteobacteria bacterium]|nr:hypothetical protein [Gammaproteobacteria bacterium]MDH3508361.1 hypothetical protein [Gammaproteobacteria bacterium]
MRAGDDFDGDQCIVLPANYLASVDAAVELYDEDIAKASDNMRISGLEYGLGRVLFRIALTAVLFWLLPSLWMLCV